MAVASPYAVTEILSGSVYHKAQKLFLKAVAETLREPVSKTLIKDRPICPSCEAGSCSQFKHCLPPDGCLYWGLPVHKREVIVDHMQHLSRIAIMTEFRRLCEEDPEITLSNVLRFMTESDPIVRIYFDEEWLDKVIAMLPFPKGMIYESDPEVYRPEVQWPTLENCDQL